MEYSVSEIFVINACFYKRDPHFWVKCDEFISIPGLSKRRNDPGKCTVIIREIDTQDLR